MFHPLMHTRRRSIWRLRPEARPLTQPWRWPLMPLHGAEPIVLATHDVPRLGVDLGYEDRPDIPLRVPVYAAQDGLVMFAGRTKSGCAISLDHKKHGWVTHYAHLSTMFVAPRLSDVGRPQTVRAGDVIGFAARSPIHVRFELWNWTDEERFVAVDPIEMLTAWIGPLSRAQARNAA